MQKVPHFCPQCGTPVVYKRQSCPQCGACFDDRFQRATIPPKITAVASLQVAGYSARSILNKRPSFSFARKNLLKSIGCGLGLLLLCVLVTSGITGDQLLSSPENRTAIAYAQQATPLHESLQQAQGQTQQDLQAFQEALSQKGAQQYSNIQAFSQRFSEDEALLTTAHTVKQYSALSDDAHIYTQNLNMIETTYNQIADFGSLLDTLKSAQFDTTALQTEYSDDQQQFNTAQHPGDFVKLNTLVASQQQQAEVEIIQTFPYTSTFQLHELQAQIDSLKNYGVDISQYQAQLSSAQATLNSAKTIQNDLAFSSQVEADLNAVQVPLLQGEAHYLVQEFHQAVYAWAQANPYVDTYNGQTYALDNGYMNNGIGAKLDSDLGGASSADDFKIVIHETNNDLFNLHMLEADYHDRTPYNQVHATDLQLLSHYHLQSGQVLVVSLVEQVMRVYQHGKLVRSFYVTTGQPAKPALPGVWSVLSRQSPIIFTAGEPKSSPLWFPDTPIQYAIMYHYGGYFVHDAWWRTVFGPGTQFPHLDRGGTQYAQTGSHGCINLDTSDAAWVYSQTNWNTTIVVY